MKRKLRLTFPPDRAGEPIAARLVKEFNLEFNILQAHVYPGMEGELLLELRGNDDDIARSMTFLSESGIVVNELSRCIVWDSSKCMHCGCCTAVCPSGALRLGEDAQLQFLPEECFLCESCISTCPVKTLRIRYEQ